jgi:hypothetical protein
MARLLFRLLTRLLFRLLFCGVDGEGAMELVSEAEPVGATFVLALALDEVLGH